MSLKLTKECYESLMAASKKTGLSYTDIANRALRKFNRLRTETLVASFEEFESDYNLMEMPINIRFKPSLVEGKSADLQRNILTWYLKSTKITSKQTPINLSKRDFDYMHRAPNGEDLANEYLQKVQ